MTINKLTCLILVVFCVFTGVTHGQAPVGISPKTEMPIMSQVAPEKCLFYMSCTGTEASKPNSANLTERLFAEPQIQALIKSIDSTIQQSFKDQDNAATIYALTKQLLNRPWMLFVSNLEVGKDKQIIKVQAGAIIHLGNQQKTFEETFQTRLKKANIPAEIQTTATIDGKKFNRISLGPGKTVTWGIHDQMFLVGIGDGTIEAMLKRTKTPAPSWLIELKKQLPIERRATTIYANLASLREIHLASCRNDGYINEKTFTEMLSKLLGLSNLESIQVSAGLDEQGIIERVKLDADGPLTGVLGSLVGQPLTAKDLDAVPADANLVCATKFNRKHLYTLIDALKSTLVSCASLPATAWAR